MDKYIRKDRSVLRKHCKLTRRRRSNSIDFTVTTLRDSVVPLVLILHTSVRKANLFSYISRLQNSFVLFKSSSQKGVMIEKHFRFQSYEHFTLV